MSLIHVFLRKILVSLNNPKPRVDFSESSFKVIKLSKS